MRNLNVREAKTTLSAVLAEIEATGEVFLICRNGRSIAELRPVAGRRGRLATRPDTASVAFVDDPTAPLSPEDWGELT